MAGRESRKYTKWSETIMQKLILIGGGGHCKACIDVIEQEGIYKIVGILDKKELLGKKILEYRYIGTDDDIGKFSKEGYHFLITVGQIALSAIRKKLATILHENNAKIVTIISPRAYVSKYATIGKGTIIMHDVLVNVSVSIGEHCIVNTKVLIEHDVMIEDFCHISTSAVVNGGVKIKEGTFFGSNAVSKEYVETSSDDFIKAGTTYKGLS